MSRIGIGQSTGGQPNIDVTNLIPKSPQSDQLVRVSEITVNSARGVPNLSYNLYTATVGGIKIPITISYDASGIRVEDVPSSVGMKWSLSAGGELSRSINGRPDEDTYFNNSFTYNQARFAVMDPNTDSTQGLLESIYNNLNDFSSDQYSYNYLDKSGYFYFRKNKLWSCEEPYTVKIETDTPFTLHNVRFTDEGGNTAWFAGGEDLSTVFYSGQGYATPNYPSDGVTAWKMSKIHTYTNEEATFEYEGYTYSTYRIAAESYTLRHDQGQGYEGAYLCNCGTSSYNESDIGGTFNINLISQIHTPLENIQFFYSTDNTLPVYQRRLDSLVVTGKTDQRIIKRIHFVYLSYPRLELQQIWNMGSNGDSLLIAGFHYSPGSESFSQSSLSRDIFNYNNGVANTYLISTSDVDPSVPTMYKTADRSVTAAVSSGIIDSVYTPTGGKIAFYYSPNQVGTIFGPGARTDSIVYLNYDGSLASKTTYLYADPQNGTTFNGYVDNVANDNDNVMCPVKTYNSERFVYNTVSPFYYGNVEIRKKGAVASEGLLTKEYYDFETNGYVMTQPIVRQRIYFRNNDPSDTVKVENYTYEAMTEDSLKMDWLRPGSTYLPAQFYILNGILHDNLDVCSIIYTMIGSYGTIEPRKKLVYTAQVALKDQLNSQLQLSSYTNTTYNGNWQPAAAATTNSKGKLDSTIYNYLYSNPGSLGGVVAGSNLLGLVGGTSRYTDNNTLLENTRNHYSLQNSLVLPDSVLTQKLPFPEAVQGVITGYDALGHVTEINKKAGFYSSLLRDYNGQLVIASASNARISDIAYTSFEADGTGTWTIGNPTPNTTTGITGNNCHTLASDITRSGLNSGTTYIVSYWSDNSGAYSIPGTISGYPVQGRSVLIKGTQWTYHEHKVSGQTAIQLNGSGKIDELRLYPDGSQMTTYTYFPLIGTGCETDAANRISYYEYDGFNRLKVIRDLDGNIIKTYEYHYKK